MPNPTVPVPGKSVVLGYDADDKSYPVIGIRRDPNAGLGMTPPNMLSAHPDSAKYPNHIFTGVVVEEPDLKSFWQYRIIPGPQVVSFDRDDEAQATVTITKQVVLKPADAAAVTALNSPGTEVKYFAQNDFFGLLVTMSIGATPTGRVETEWRDFTYPALVVAITANTIEALDGTVRVEINWQHRAARQLPSLHKQTISYAAFALLSIPALEYDPQLQDLDRSGIFLNPPVMHGVLNDAITDTFNTASDNPKWGYVTETLSYIASNPSATDYINSYIGNYKINGAVLAPWKYNLWRLVVTRVLMR